MAIGPNQLNENFMAEVDFFEGKIDRALANKKVAPKSSINVDVPTGMSYSHYQILKERYIKAGWTDVKWYSDQREGCWLSFSLNVSTHSSDWRDL
jgi:hypothetical protein